MTTRQSVPKPLSKGDTLGIIAPAGQLREQLPFTEGLKIIREMGFKVKFPKDLWPGQDYLADNDFNRAKEVNQLFSDSEVDGIVSMRGGYGCLRMLDMVDVQIVASNPKPLIGFSDISILQNFLFSQTGLISFHGPVLTSLSTLDDQSLLSFYSILTGTGNEILSRTTVEILRDAPTVTGPLVGGNLSSLVTLLGTEFDFSWKDKLVFLEDTNEPIYKIDRMLTQLHLAGKFRQSSGIILGDFSFAHNSASLDSLRYKEAVWQRVLEVTSECNIPVWGQFPSGHSSHNISFPIGAVAQMNHERGRLLVN